MGCCEQSGFSLADDDPRLQSARTRQDFAAEAGLEPVSDDIDKEAAEILLQGDLRLVSGIWLLSQHQPYRVQKLQELPPEALVPPRDAAAMMLETPGDRTAPPRILALSYRWLSKEHPDPGGIQLLKVRGFLHHMVLAVFRSKPDASTREELDIGILWDYMSLPQHPRSASENDVFLRGLKAINRVYGSRKNTITLQCIGDPDGSHPYHKSGWCRFEEAVSGIGKVGSRLLAVDGEVPQPQINQMCAVNFVPPHRGHAVLEDHGLRSVANELQREYAKGSSLQDWIWLCSVMSTSRLPPIHPDDMARLLRSNKVVFTSQSDSEMVIQKYQDFFRQVADTMVRLEYGHKVLSVDGDKIERYAKVTWSLEQFRLLGNALGEGGLHKCTYLSLGGINLSKAGACALAEALSRASSLKEVQLPTEIKRMDSVYVGKIYVEDQSVERAAISLLSKKLAELSINVSYATAVH